MTHPLISVLVPLYNARQTVTPAIESLLGQTYRNFEVVAVDDGSEDETVAVLERAADGDERVRLIRSSHVGLVPALNLGISQCRGELLARMDGDDVCHPRRLELQMEMMQADRSLSVCSCLVRSFPRCELGEGFRRYENWMNSLVTHEEIVRDIFVESPVAHPSVMLRTQELRDLGGYMERGWPEDYDLWLRYHNAGKRFGKVRETLLFWRTHGERLTFTDSRYSLENFIRAKAHYLAELLAPKLDEVIVWGAGMTGRRLTKHLMREGLNVELVVDIDPKKIGRTMRGIPIISPDHLEEHRDSFVITAVGSQSARELIRERLLLMGRTELQDFICAS